MFFISIDQRQINKPQSKPFFVSTIYRPPNAPAEFFDCFETLIKQIDDENKEMYILGDLNCNLLQEKALFNVPTSKLNSIYELYQLSQLINEPTRVTLTTSSLIDHVVTNTPEKISHSGVMHTGISDHSLIYAIRKIKHFQKNDDFVEIRNMKNFNENNFVNELLNQHWDCIYFFGKDPNHMWEIWKELFLEVLNKHAPLQHKKPKPSKVPWITTEIKSLINERDKLKRKTIITKLETDWSKYKRTRNEVNIKLRIAKTNYYSSRIFNQKSNPKKAWRSINNLLGKRNKNSKINELRDRSLYIPQGGTEEKLGG